MAIANGFINATLTTLYTSSGSNAITSMIFCNYMDTDNILGGGTVLTDSETYLDLHIVKQGQATSDANKILHMVKLPGGETFIMDSERIVLDNGDMVVAQTTSPATVNFMISIIPV
jgi:hypothetical protein